MAIQAMPCFSYLLALSEAKGMPREYCALA